MFFMVYPNIIDEIYSMWVYAMKGEIEDLQIDLLKQINCIVFVHEYSHVNMNRCILQYKLLIMTGKT